MSRKKNDIPVFRYENKNSNKNKEKGKGNIFNDLDNKFKNELYDFEFINSESINNLKIGHIVRYVNLNDELKWGGILVKMLYPNKPTECILRLRNSKGNFWDIKFINFYIFFKYRNSKAENFQKLFLKMIDDI